MKAAATRGDFFEAVYELVRLIPYGRVTSYGAIANAIGSKGASRMVGWAMNHSHNISPAVPAHRVVNRSGMLTGQAHFGKPGRMQELLEQEGIEVTDNRVVHFSSLFWDPQTEIRF